MLFDLINIIFLLLEKKDDRLAGPLTDKDRITVPCFASDYNYINFVAYVLYTPLYLCGPIITFNDFISQVHSQMQT